MGKCLWMYSVKAGDRGVVLNCVWWKSCGGCFVGICSRGTMVMGCYSMLWGVCHDTEGLVGLCHRYAVVYREGVIERGTLQSREEAQVKGQCFGNPREPTTSPEKATLAPQYLSDSHDGKQCPSTPYLSPRHISVLRIPNETLGWHVLEFCCL